MLLHVMLDMLVSAGIAISDKRAVLLVLVQLLD